MPTRTLPLAAVLLATFTSVFSVTSLSAVFRIDNPNPAANAEFGTGIAGLGDQNGDGVPDFAVGAPGADRVDVFSGKDRTLIRSLHDPEGLTGLQFGYAVIGIGDVNGDGVQDMAVGAPGPFGFLPLPCDPTAPACVPPEWGRVFVFSGATGALIRKIVPTSEYFAFGFSLAPLGDLNGDGVPDLAVGAPEFLNNRWGEVYAFSGRPAANCGYSANLLTRSSRRSRPSASTLRRWAISTAMDVATCSWPRRSMTTPVQERS